MSNLTLEQFENYDVSDMDHDQLHKFIHDFYNASLYKGWNCWNLNKWNVSNCTNMSNMFSDCRALSHSNQVSNNFQCIIDYSKTIHPQMKQLLVALDAEDVKRFLPISDRKQEKQIEELTQNLENSQNEFSALKQENEQLKAQVATLQRINDKIHLDVKTFKSNQ